MSKNKKAIIVVLIGLILWGLYFYLFPPVKSSGNLLTNSSFEYDKDKNNIPDGWGKEKYNSKLAPKGKKSKYYLSVTNTNNATSIGSQKIPLDGRKIKLISVSAYVKADNIQQGGQPWETGKIQIIFFDKNDKQIAGWPEVQSYTGSFDWKFAKKVFQVPIATRYVQVNLGLWNCRGEIGFDDIQLMTQRPKALDKHNYVINGNFEVWQGWVYGGSNNWGILYPGYVGDSLLYINNTSRMWSFASQSIKLDSKQVSKITISAFMKVNNVVRGTNTWEKARLNIEFKNEDGERLGGWPIVSEAEGAADWKKVENTFEVPKGTKKVELFAGLLNCTGEVWFDEIVMNAFDKDGNKLVAPELYKTQTDKDWFVFTPQPLAKNSVLDLSERMYRPAGKYGPVQLKEGKFVFKNNGARAKFWGTNVYGPQVFLPKEEAMKMADRLAQTGFNLVRIHHADAAWSNPNVFDPKASDTQHFSADSMDKLDFFIAELEKRGIYIYMDLLVHRGFKAGDGVRDVDQLGNGAKITALFDPKLIDLQKKYADALLNHKNPYTGKKYIDDPAIVLLDIVNENSLFYIAQETWLPQSYVDQLDGLWNKWLLQKYFNQRKLDEVYVNKYGAPLLEDNELIGRNVKRGKTTLAKYRPENTQLDAREKDTLQFYYELERKYFTDMKDYLKKLGVKIPIAGSNHWENIELDMKANTTLDFIDRHRYWNHPQFGYGVSVTFDNHSMLNYPQKSLPAILAAQRVKNMPFVISEWNTCWPGDYYIEGPVLMASYARLQDWDGVLTFSFNSPDYIDVLSDNFDISALPNMLSQMMIAGDIFYNGEVPVAQEQLYEYRSPEALSGLIQEDRGVFDRPELSLVARVGKYFEQTRRDRAPNTPLPQVEANIIKARGVYKNTTGQLLWDSQKGQFTLNGNRILGTLGFFKGEVRDLGIIKIDCSTDFASIFLLSRDGRPIYQSQRMLLVASARAENSGMVYNTMKTQIVDIGDGPILLEGVKSLIQFKVRESEKADSIKVQALDFSGKPVKRVPVKIKKGYAEFEISLEYKTLYYLITRG